MTAVSETRSPRRRDQADWTIAGVFASTPIEAASAILGDADRGKESAKPMAGREARPSWRFEL
jgi:hypothetical protein